MDACPNIRLIAVLATGYNVVDYSYAKQKGIPVVNVPADGTMSVSQYSIALLLEICHHIGHHDATVHQGKWQNNEDWCYWDYPLIELDGKTTVKYAGDANIRGTIARVGARMIQPAARQIVGQFFGCLESKATQAK